MICSCTSSSLHITATQMPSATAPTEEHKVTVTVPVHGKNSQTGPREVRNQFFDDESDEEPEVQEKNANLSEAEQIEESMRNMGKPLQPKTNSTIKLICNGGSNLQSVTLCMKTTACYIKITYLMLD